MGWLNVLGLADGLDVIPPPVFPSSIYKEYYPPPVVGGQPPLAPSSLGAVAISSSQIDLSWTDNSNDEDGFDIERTEGGANAIIASVSADATSYSDTGLAAGTSYSYRVRSYHLVNGNSQYSNTATAVTLSGNNPSTMTVDSVNVTTFSVKSDKHGRAEVVVRDDIGGLVANAAVSGEFRGDIVDVVAGLTDSTGQVTFDSTTASGARGKLNLTFCVTGMAHDTLADVTGIEVCGSL